VRGKKDLQQNDISAASIRYAYRVDLLTLLAILPEEPFCATKTGSGLHKSFDSGVVVGYIRIAFISGINRTLIGQRFV
jgi:hypothetical protein